MTMEKIMTAKELGQFLKLSESTIYKLASNGEIPGFKIGDSWRFELEEIQKLIRDSKKKGRKQRDPVEEREERKRLLEREQ
jgi:excisionase family DNA binding protein